MENVLRALSWPREVTIRSYEVFRSSGWELELVIVEGGWAATPGRLGGWIVRGPLEYGASLREVWEGRLSGALEVESEMEAGGREESRLKSCGREKTRCEDRCWDCLANSEWIWSMNCLSTVTISLPARSLSLSVNPDMLPLDIDLVGDPELGMFRPKEVGMVILVLAV